VQPSDIVTEAAFERELAMVRSSAAGGAAGIFGPDSMTWRVDREAAIFLGAGRALLLQLAHPWVAAAIAEHSRTLPDPMGRFHRTFNLVFTMVFGTTDQAVAASRRLYRRHAEIEGILTESVGAFAAGSAYRANEVAALRWVHATLTETAVLAYQLVNPPLSTADRERYYAEARLVAALFGIPQTALPQSWASFAGYADRMLGSADLTVGDAARSVAAALFSGAGDPAAHSVLVSRPDRGAVAAAAARRVSPALWRARAARRRAGVGGASACLSAGPGPPAPCRTVPRGVRPPCRKHAAGRADAAPQPLLDRAQLDGGVTAVGADASFGPLGWRLAGDEHGAAGGGARSDRTNERIPRAGWD
jgi:uncharacterized protein (DUF2236 family)